MTELPDRVRLYDEDEVGRLLKRATELQKDDPPRYRDSGGLSLRELEEIAVEAGIDPRHLRQAAAELDTTRSDPDGWTRALGEQVTLVQEAVIPGELPEEGFERVLEVIQSTVGEHGQPSLMGHTLTWQAETAEKTRSIQVVVSVRRGETRIRAEERLHQFASGLFAGTTVGVGAGLGVGVGLPVGLKTLGSVLFATAFPIGIVGLTFLMCREIYRRVVRKRRSVMARLVSGVVAEATAAIAEVTPTPTPLAEGPPPRRGLGGPDSTP